MSSVRLIHSTPDGDDLVAYMARVSNPDNQNNTETSARLIKYLIKHKHWSPFEMVNMCVEINTTRSIAAQILLYGRAADPPMGCPGATLDCRSNDPHWVLEETQAQAGAVVGIPRVVNHTRSVATPSATLIIDYQDDKHN